MIPTIGTRMVKQRILRINYGGGFSNESATASEKGCEMLPNLLPNKNNVYVNVL